MSIRIYIGNLPQGFNPKEFDTLLKSVSDSIRFKAVLDGLPSLQCTMVSIVET